MKLQELPARAYLAHLRRHPVPELMDEECVAALANTARGWKCGWAIRHGSWITLCAWIRTGSLPSNVSGTR